MEISIERSPKHWCPSVVPNFQPLDPELDALDHSATAPYTSELGFKNYSIVIVYKMAACRSVYAKDL